MYRELAWTEAAEAHIVRHAVSPGEVEDTINSRPVLTRRGIDAFRRKGHPS